MMRLVSPAREATPLRGATKAGSGPPTAPSIAFVLILALVLTVQQARSEDLLVAGWSSHNLNRYDGETGDFVETFVPAQSGGLRNAHSIHPGPDGNLYVTSNNNGMVLRFSGTNGALVDTFVTPGSGGLVGPADGIFGPDGNFYVSDLAQSMVLRYDGSSGDFIDVFVDSGSGGLSGAEQLLFGAGDTLYVASLNGSLKRYNGTTGDFIDTHVQGSGLVSPHGFLFMPDSDILVASFGGAQNILRYNADGSFDSVFVAGGTGGLSSPHHIQLGPDGDLFVASFGSNEVIRFDGVDGDFVEVFAESGNGIASPAAILFHDTSVGIGDADLTLATGSGIESVFPNPGSTVQRLLVRGTARSGLVTLEIHDSVGRLIRRLRLEETQFANGSVEITWDGRSDRGETVPSAVYYARISGQAGPSTRVVRMR